MKAFLAIALLCCAVGVATAVTEEGVIGLFDAWNAALATGDPDRVADMYAEDSILLPTLSNTPATTRELKLDYFREFLKKNPVGVLDESHVEIFGDSVASNAGVYTFTFTDSSDGHESSAQARYTFLYEKQPEGQWLIKEHHSSLMPEKHDATLDDIVELFTTWNATLQTGDPAAVAALYHNTSTMSLLLPTVSDKPADTYDEKIDYFTKFLKLHPSGTIDVSWPRWTSDDKTSAVHSGIYTFQTDNGPVQARFTYVYQLLGGEWKIVEHHSSKMPEQVEAACAEQVKQVEAVQAAGRKLML